MPGKPKIEERLSEAQLIDIARHYRDRTKSTEELGEEHGFWRGYVRRVAQAGLPLLKKTEALQADT